MAKYRMVPDHIDEDSEELFYIIQKKAGLFRWVRWGYGWYLDKEQATKLLKELNGQAN